MLVEADNGGVTDTPLGNWLRKHGRVVRIPLTREQRLIAYETFAILDLDGSGRMDVEELQVVPTTNQYPLACAFSQTHALQEMPFMTRPARNRMRLKA